MTETTTLGFHTRTENNETSQESANITGQSSVSAVKFASVFKSDTFSQGFVSDPTEENVIISDDVCRTDACVAAGKMIKSSLNESVDPCEDFYAYACGGWDASHTIPADKSRWSSFDELDEFLKTSIKEELSRPSRSTDANAVVYAADYYKSCLDEGSYHIVPDIPSSIEISDTIDSRGVAPLESVLQSIGGWPLAGKSGANADWEDSWASSVVGLALAPIYSISVQPDANDTLVHRVYVSIAAKNCHYVQAMITISFFSSTLRLSDWVATNWSTEVLIPISSTPTRSTFFSQQFF